MKNRDLHQLWEALIDIYIEISKVCDRYNLRYSIAYGTMLGAVRHNGFIPWDDDFDMFMPRHDYLEFCKHIDELPEYLQLICWQNTSHYTQAFAKIQDCRKSLVQFVETEIGGPLPQGIYVDIFIVDGYPKSKFKCYIRRLQERIVYAMLISISEKWSSIRTFKAKLGWLVGRFVRGFLGDIKSRYDLMPIIEHIAMQYDYDDEMLVGVYDSVSMRTDVIGPSNIFCSDTIDHAFESINVKIPIGYQEFLSRSYGDYMKLPDSNKRYSFHDNVPNSPWRWTETGKRPNI